MSLSHSVRLKYSRKHTSYKYTIYSLNIVGEMVYRLQSLCEVKPKSRCSICRFKQTVCRVWEPNLGFVGLLLLTLSNTLHSVYYYNSSVLVWDGVRVEPFLCYVLWSRLCVAGFWHSPVLMCSVWIKLSVWLDPHQDAWCGDLCVE